MGTPNTRHVAAVALLGFATLFTGLGVALSNASDAKSPDLTELREAVAAAARRGDNVDEIGKAIDALEQSLAKGFTAPEAGKTAPPSAELVALHKAVESAARKGENVEEIRKLLEPVEKALTGKSLTTPKPQPREPQPDLLEVPPQQLPGRMPRIQPANPFVMPGLGINNEDMQKAQELTRRATELLLKDPSDPNAVKLMEEAHELMLKGVMGGRANLVPPMNLNIPDFGRARDRFRLGVRLERISELAADQLGIEVARGVGIADVVEGSPAAKAGFKTHDIVLEFAGKPVTDNPEDFTHMVNSVKPGEKIDAVVMRKGKRVEIKGIDMPATAQEFPRVGFDGLPQLPEARQQPRIPRPAVVGAEGGRGQGRTSMAVSDVNGQITLKAVSDGVQYVIHAERNADKVDFKSATITNGDKKTEADSLDKVPAEYRPAVDRFLKGLQGRP
jgi:hypothetical protein